MRWPVLAISFLLASCGAVQQQPSTKADTFDHSTAYGSALGGMLVGMLVGAAAGAAVAEDRSSDRSSSSDEENTDLSGVAGLFVGGAVGGSLGAAIGVSLYGAAALPPGHRGSFTLGLLGSALSTAVGLLALVSDGPAAGFLAFTGYFVLPPIGAVFGYDAGIPSSPLPPPPASRPAAVPATGHAFMVPVLRLAF